MPRATASRFMVPPAETTRSASATRLWASTARSGTTTEGSSRALTYSRWASVRGSTTACTRLVLPRWVRTWGNSGFDLRW